MFLPLHDGVPLRNLKTPIATRILIGVCTAVYLTTVLAPGSASVLVAGFGLIPGVVFGTEILPPGYPFVAPPLTLTTTIFIHVGLVHLAGNMLFLWVFGDNVEDAMGHGRFLVFFVLCGTAASLVHALVSPEQHRPLIGASGGVSGVVAAYLILYPAGAGLGPLPERNPLAPPRLWSDRILVRIAVRRGVLRRRRGRGMVRASWRIPGGRYSHPGHAASLRSCAGPRRGAGDRSLALTIGNRPLRSRPTRYRA